MSSPYSLNLSNISEESDPAQLLSLNCFILGDKSNQTFTIEVSKIKNVSILKDLIKERHLTLYDLS